tara:strand:+ start:1844 stop:2125 length:282 start_codon:yes stop_codon:yes gene_type:complete
MLRVDVDTSGIDMTDPDIPWELGTDLRRMDHLQHTGAPEGADAYRVTVTPSQRTYVPGFHRFRFEIQYGRVKEDEFEPIGDSVWKQSEGLPLI